MTTWANILSSATNLAVLGTTMATVSTSWYLNRYRKRHVYTTDCVGSLTKRFACGLGPAWPMSASKITSFTCNVTIVYESGDNSTTATVNLMPFYESVMISNIDGLRHKETQDKLKEYLEFCINHAEAYATQTALVRDAKVEIRNFSVVARGNPIPIATDATSTSATVNTAADTTAAGTTVKKASPYAMISTYATNHQKTKLLIREKNGAGHEWMAVVRANKEQFRSVWRIKAEYSWLEQLTHVTTAFGSNKN